MTRSLRLLAGALVLALPLGAAAGCGAEKKKTVRQEFEAAQAHLSDSKAASFTIHFGDTQGNLLKSMTKDGDMPAAVAQALLKGSITYVADAAGDATLGSGQGLTDPTDLKAAFTKANLGIVLRDDKDVVAELRILAGDLYARINLAEIGRLAKASGVDDFDAQLDDNLGAMDPRIKQALADVRAGKWLKLPLAKYLDKLDDMVQGMSGTTRGAKPSIDATSFGKRLYAAMKPFVKVTDANDSSTDRVLDVDVQARPALKAALGVMGAEPGLPFAGMFKSVQREIDSNVKDGVAKGQIRLHESHLTQVSVDLESIRQLSTDPGTDSFAGVQVKVDVDDSADELEVPGNLSTVDVGAVVEELLGGFFNVGRSEIQTEGFSYSSS